MFTSFDAIVRCQATDEAIICCQADLEWITRRLGRCRSVQEGKPERRWRVGPSGMGGWAASGQTMSTQLWK
ncbi:unnamed protein product [Boreogadus saida]